MSPSSPRHHLASREHKYPSYHRSDSRPLFSKYRNGANDGKVRYQHHHYRNYNYRNYHYYDHHSEREPERKHNSSSNSRYNSNSRDNITNSRDNITNSRDNSISRHNSTNSRHSSNNGYHHYQSRPYRSSWYTRRVKESDTLPKESEEASTTQEFKCKGCGHCHQLTIKNNIIIIQETDPDMIDTDDNSEDTADNNSEDTDDNSEDTADNNSEDTADESSVDEDTVEEEEAGGSIEED